MQDKLKNDHSGENLELELTPEERFFVSLKKIRVIRALETKTKDGEMLADALSDPNRFYVPRASDSEKEETDVELEDKAPLRASDYPLTYQGFLRLKDFTSNYLSTEAGLDASSPFSPSEKLNEMVFTRFIAEINFELYKDLEKHNIDWVEKIFKDLFKNIAKQVAKEITSKIKNDEENEDILAVREYIAEMVFALFGDASLRQKLNSISPLDSLLFVIVKDVVKQLFDKDGSRVHLDSVQIEDIQPHLVGAFLSGLRDKMNGPWRSVVNLFKRKRDTGERARLILQDYIDQGGYQALFDGTVKTGVTGYIHPAFGEKVNKREKTIAVLVSLSEKLGDEQLSQTEIALLDLFSEVMEELEDIEKAERNVKNVLLHAYVLMGTKQNLEVEIGKLLHKFTEQYNFEGMNSDTKDLIAKWRWAMQGRLMEIANDHNRVAKRRRNDFLDKARNQYAETGMTSIERLLDQSADVSSDENYFGSATITDE